MGMGEDDIRVLEIFATNSRALSEAVKKHVPQKTTIKFEIDQPTKVDGVIEDTVEAGLVGKARLFMGDNVSEFGRIVNILSRYHHDDVAKVERLRQYKKAWKKAFDLHPLFQIGSEEDNLTNKRVFEIITNGKHLHSTEFDEHFKLQNSWVYPLVKVQLEAVILNIQKLTTMLNLEFVQPILSERSSS